jgi:hypothetical protein
MVKLIFTLGKKDFNQTKLKKVIDFALVSLDFLGKFKKKNDEN